MKSVRSITLRTRKVLAFWLLLSLSAAQVFAMPMDSMPMDASHNASCTMTQHADIDPMAQHEIIESTATPSCADMSSQDCSPDHCMSVSAMTLGTLNLLFPIAASTVPSTVMTTGSSIDTYPPYYPPITH